MWMSAGAVGAHLHHKRCVQNCSAGTEAQRHRDTETQRHGDSETQRHSDRETGKQGDRETERQSGRETERQRGRETERYRHGLVANTFANLRFHMIWGQALVSNV